MRYFLSDCFQLPMSIFRWEGVCRIPCFQFVRLAALSCCRRREKACSQLKAAVGICALRATSPPHTWAINSGSQIDVRVSFCQTGSRTITSLLCCSCVRASVFFSNRCSNVSAKMASLDSRLELLWFYPYRARWKSVLQYKLNYAYHLSIFKYMYIYMYI